MSHAGQMKWVDKDSFLRITVLSPKMVARLAVRIRQYTAQGRLVKIEQTCAVSGLPTRESFFIPLNEGWIESISVGDSSFIVSRGRVFVQFAIQQDKDAQALPHTILAADYFDSSVGLQWPGTPIRHHRDGPGYLSSANISNPGAGANFSWTIDTLNVLRIISITFKFTTDVTVANRRVMIAIYVGGILAIPSVCGSLQTASLAVDYPFADYGMQTTAVNSAMTLSPLPPNVFLKKNDSIVSNIALIQAGDQISDINVVYEEWVEER